MAVTLNDTAFRHAKDLIRDGKVVRDDRDAWSEDAPTPDEENGFIESNGWSQYSRWYLGLDDDHPDDTKGHYKFPIGDLRKIHRCAVISAESRAGQYNHDEIRDALGKLLKEIDAE